MAQFTNVPSKSHVRCVPSQKGLLLERPQRHIANCTGWGISRPSGALRWTGPETRYGPFSLGVMVTSCIQSTSPFELVDLDGSRHWQPTNADASQREIALASAGATVGTLTSPTPLGVSDESIKCTS